VGNNLCQRQGGSLDVIAALDNLEVRRLGGDGEEIFVGSLIGEVAETEGLAYLSWREELFELQRGISRTFGRDDSDSRRLTLAGMSRARSGMCRSPITSMRNAMAADQD
jgi:hypothetical protein